MVTYVLAFGSDLLLSITTISYVGYFVLSVSSLVMASQRPLVFATLLLVDIIQENRLLKYVLRSVYSSRGSLAQTGMLTIIFIYIFTVAAFTYFNDDFRFRGEEYNCKSLIACLAYNLNFGLRYGLTFLFFSLSFYYFFPLSFTAVSPVSR